MKMRSATYAVIAGTILAVVLVLMSTGGSVQEERLRIAYFPNIGHAVPIIGIEKDFFSSRIGSQASIETRLFDSGPQVIESLFADSVDVAYVGPGPAINGFLNSEQNSIKILSGAASGGASFVVHPNSKITAASDFAGKKIAAPQIGNTQDVSLRHYLAESGLKAVGKGGNVTIYNIPNPDIYTMFVKSDIDGAWVAEPWATILESELGGTRLFHEENLWPNEEFASVLLIGNINYVRENPLIIKSMLLAHEDTVQWINENPSEARDTFNQFLTEVLGQPLPNPIVDAALSNLEITTDPIPGSVHAFAERADSLGYLGRNGYDLTGIFYDAGSGA